MLSISFAHAFLATGVGLANLAAYVAFARTLSAWWRASHFLALFAIWIATYQLHERGAPAPAMPGQALAVAVALFVVFGFPAFVTRQLQAKGR